MLADRLKLSALRLLPKNAVSRAFGIVADIPLPPGVRDAVNHGFASLAGIDVQECESGPGTYGSLNAFFTRRLREGARPIETTGGADLVCPADGRIDQFGEIRLNTLVQAKGRSYKLVDLLDSGRDAARFEGGQFATIYLSPRDYHRVHSPVQGRVERVSYVPGQLFPVNPFAVANVDRLFVVNERLTAHVETEELGPVGVVMVGATCVGKISLAFHPFVTNASFRRREDITLEDPVDLEHGDELGMFNLGSTVILLVANPAFRFRDDLVPGTAVRMGELLGSAHA